MTWVRNVAENKLQSRGQSSTPLQLISASSIAAYLVSCPFFLHSFATSDRGQHDTASPSDSFQFPNNVTNII